MDELDLDASGTHFVDQGGEEVVDAIARVEGGVDEVHADGPEGVLLASCILIPETKMEDDLAWLGLWMVLKADPDPRVTLPFAVMGGRRHRVGEGEEAGHRATFSLQTID